MDTYSQSQPSTTSSSSTPSAAASIVIPPRRRRGRPSGYSDEVIDLICYFIREEGISDTAAAEAAGVSSSTVSRWKTEHEELEGEFALARSEFRSAQLAIIRKATAAGRHHDWRAAAWLLAHVFPEDYSLKSSERTAHRERQKTQRADTDLTNLSDLDLLHGVMTVDRLHEFQRRRQAALDAINAHNSIP